MEKRPCFLLNSKEFRQPLLPSTTELHDFLLKRRSDAGSTKEPLNYCTYLQKLR